MTQQPQFEPLNVEEAVRFLRVSPEFAGEFAKACKHLHYYRCGDALHVSHEPLSSCPDNSHKLEE
jgi:hypothetical protein